MENEFAQMSLVEGVMPMGVTQSALNAWTVRLRESSVDNKDERFLSLMLMTCI